MKDTAVITHRAVTVLGPLSTAMVTGVNGKRPLGGSVEKNYNKTHRKSGEAGTIKSFRHPRLLACADIARVGSWVCAVSIICRQLCHGSVPHSS